MIYGYVADLFSVSFGNFGNFGIFGDLPHFHPKTPKTLKTLSGFRFSVIGFRRGPARPVKVPYDPRYECISYVNRRSLCRPTCPTRHFVLLLALHSAIGATEGRRLACASALSDQSDQSDWGVGSRLALHSALGATEGRRFACAPATPPHVRSCPFMSVPVRSGGLFSAGRLRARQRCPTSPTRPTGAFIRGLPSIAPSARRRVGGQRARPCHAVASAKAEALFHLQMVIKKYKKKT